MIRRISSGEDTRVANLWVVVTVSMTEKHSAKKKIKVWEWRNRFLNELHTTVHFTLPLITRTEETCPIHCSPPINILPLSPSIWLRGMRRFHVIASVHQYHYIQSGCCISTSPPPHSLHLSIYSHLKLTYLYFSPFLCLYRTCLHPWWVSYIKIYHMISKSNLF